jgi:hypothetical protein
MPESKEQAKAAKKLAKAQAKALKKGRAQPPDSGSKPDDPAGLTPAERSARAAEQQLAVRRWQMWIALAMMLVALTTFIVRLFLG